MLMAHNTTKDSQIDVLDRINAMRLREEKISRCKSYFNSVINSACRKAMVEWLFICVDTFGLSRETVGVAMSILDRYLSSGNGKSAEVLENKQKFQLAAITSFYMAIKISEPLQLDIDFVVKLCRGYYKGSDVTVFEQDILTSLEWRVCLSTTTPMEYVRHFLELLPELSFTAEAIQENAMRYMDYATADPTFAMYRTSDVGIACLAGALDDACAISSLEKENLWHQLSKKLEFEIASSELRTIERQLLTKSTSCQPRRKSRTSLPRFAVKAVNECKSSSSPISVLH
mmetsp:Transcript_15641/g.33020  ORF Transcript_15641/g.33020 Transcript_15641/m.33020 type:complete len:287 (+) Transcript_15641:161-1021(+)|eukprot:CAMPEP_0183727992 /NCGR_PEP_ID=MMETSP0737-20130205/26946_1 /TAXON_ID=385413 /ORGANISM="Thalassiosira miniscula, Strain CCMP1093" /LENGTH=286 /DNA_ID=CAMNT_0025959795 /DNA_START=73 /DNA_END=933 /DNA_ORIENTATION=+